MKDLSISQKKEYAKTLYVHQRLNQKETAIKAGVSAKTMCDWVEKYSWDTLRVSVIITKDQQLHRLYAQINELNTKIESRPEGERYADSKEADTLVKLTAAAKQLETETGISEIIETFSMYNNWLKTHNLPEAQSQVKFQDDFIATRIKQ